MELKTQKNYHLNIKQTSLLTHAIATYVCNIHLVQLHKND